MRALGKITAEMEPLIQEMVDEHELQLHEILGMMILYVQSHAPDAIEEYEDGSVPRFFYGEK